MKERKGRCPHCQRVLLLNDATSTIRHEAPMCPQFEKMMADAVAAGSATCEGESVRSFEDDSN